MGTIIGALVVCALLAVCIAPRHARARSWEIVRSIRPIMFIANLPAVIAVAVTTALLLQVPGFSWSWWRALTGSTTGSSNMMLAGLQVLWILPIAVILLAVAVPLLAETEELLFRRGTDGWWPSAVVRSVIFGLVHLTAGVPLAVACALTIGGLWFSYQYLRGYRAAVDTWVDAWVAEHGVTEEGQTITVSDRQFQLAGVDRATAYHTAWNYQAITLLVIVAIAA